MTRGQHDDNVTGEYPHWPDITDDGLGSSDLTEADARPRGNARVIVRCCLVVVGFSLAVGLMVAGFLNPAVGTPGTGTRTYTAVDPVCTIKDKRLGAISGMATRSDGTWVINDRGATLYRLGPACTVAKAVDLAPELRKLGVTLTDVEDLATGPDGWLWMSDSGGNIKPRKSITLVGWRNAEEPLRIAKLVYPSGEHDAEALIVDMVGRANIITKVPGEKGPAQVYRTRLPLGASPEQTLRLIGDVTLKRVSGSAPGSRLVTAGDVDPTGTNVVLRTYTNAWEFSAPDGDIAAAIVSGSPRLVPLPTSKQGEAIAYNLDGSELLATGEGLPVALDRVQINRSVR